MCKSVDVLVTDEAGEKRLRSKIWGMGRGKLGKMEKECFFFFLRIYKFRFYHFVD